MRASGAVDREVPSNAVPKARAPTAIQTTRRTIRAMERLA